MISSESELDSGAPGDRDHPVGRLLDLRQRAEEEQHEDHDREELEDPGDDRASGAEHPAEHLAEEAAVGEALVELLGDLVDDLVVPVDLAHHRGVQELVGVARGVLDELGALLDHRRHHHEPEQDEDRDDAGEHDGDRAGRLIPRFVSDSTRGLIARVRKRRHHQQGDDGGQPAEGVPEPEGDDHAEGTDEADVEGRLAVQRPPGAAEPLAGGASRSSVASGAPSCPLLT